MLAHAPGSFGIGRIAQEPSHLTLDSGRCRPAGIADEAKAVGPHASADAVLIEPTREDEHRHAEVQTFADGVRATVRDHQRGAREQANLRDALRDDDVRRNRRLPQQRRQRIARRHDPRGRPCAERARPRVTIRSSRSL